VARRPGRRVTIIGGGVMGLMTAYHAAPLAEAVTVLEKSWVGDPATASFGLTRSIRNDYQDPGYARLAFEARRLWLEFQEHSGEPLLVDCGCLNPAKGSVTPDLNSTHAVEDVFTGVGGRGTGYKFAPWAGLVLAQLAMKLSTVYDIRRFAPGRFADRDAASEPEAGEVVS
jgi:glycine/D-amino acid oxidase-like deaminating enzyme